MFFVMCGYFPSSLVKRCMLFTTLLVGVACSSRRYVAKPPSISVPVLVDVYEAVRVPGLENRHFTYDTFWAALLPYLGRSVQMEVAGLSGEGREIRRLTFGSGPVDVLLWSQMHGDESTATMALADLVRFFHDLPDHPLAIDIGDRLTIHMIPMLNPDGAERFQRRNAQGIDINRDARRLQTPEGKILKKVRDTVEPSFAFNLHDQSSAVRVGDSDRGVAIALLAPAFNEARDIDDKRLRAMQVASVLVEAMSSLVGSHIAKYDDTFNPRAFGDLMGAWGSSTILIESGGWSDDPQKQHLRKTNFVGILSALDAIATGRYASYEVDLYENLSFNGRRLPDLLVSGGILAVPGLPNLRADLLIEYDRPLLQDNGRIVDIGDLEGSEAQDTLNAQGLYLIPLPEVLDEQGGLDTGTPARFVVAEDVAGQNVRFRFDGRLLDEGRQNSQH